MLEDFIFRAYEDRVIFSRGGYYDQWFIDLYGVSGQYIEISNHFYSGKDNFNIWHRFHDIENTTLAHVINAENSVTIIISSCKLAFF